MRDESTSRISSLFAHDLIGKPLHTFPDHALMRDFSHDHRWLSLNTATLRKQSDLLGIIEACARHGIRAIDPWRDQVAAIGLECAARAVRDAGLELSGYCRGGMFTSDAAHRIEMRDDNRRAIDEAKALGAPCIVLVAGGLPQYSRPGSAPSKDIAAARTQVHDAIGEMLEYARSANMPLAIEPLHPAYAADRACVNTIRQALDICDALDPTRTGALGVALDVYHIWWDPELMPQIARAGKDRLLAFHVCDWLVPTRDILNDRGMMGDGVIDIRSLRSAVEAHGFAGHCEIEIFSDAWWERPIDEVLQTCIARHRSVV
jgi:sugar phosphate isomerase/epimerase